MDMCVQVGMKLHLAVLGKDRGVPALENLHQDIACRRLTDTEKRTDYKGVLDSACQRGNTLCSMELG